MTIKSTMKKNKATKQQTFCASNKDEWSCKAMAESRTAIWNKTGKVNCQNATGKAQCKTTILSWTKDQQNQKFDTVSQAIKQKHGVQQCWTQFVFITNKLSAQWLIINELCNQTNLSAAETFSIAHKWMRQNTKQQQSNHFMMKGKRDRVAAIPTMIKSENESSNQLMMKQQSCRRMCRVPKPANEMTRAWLSECVEAHSKTNQ